MKEIDEHCAQPSITIAYSGWIISSPTDRNGPRPTMRDSGCRRARATRSWFARGSFGAFFLRLNGQPGFKVKRTG